MARNEWPEGWKVRRLSDDEVSEVIMGQSPPSATYNEQSLGLPFFQGKADFGPLFPIPRKWCTAPQKVALENDVLIYVRAPVGPTNLCREKSCIGRGLAAIRATEKLESRFLLYFLRSIESDIARLGQGSTFTAITKEQLLGIEIPLPPLDEQRRIVAWIEELTRRIEEARGLRQAARQEVAAIMLAAPAEVFGQAEQEGWEAVRLGSLLTHIQYGVSIKASTEPIGVAVIRMGNIKDGRVDLTDLKYVGLPSRERMKYLLRKGDILINRTNSPDLVGKSGLFEADGEFVFASYLIRLRVDQDKATPAFVNAYINSRPGRNYVASRRRRAIAQANINAKEIGGMPIPLPPLSEQRRIVAYLDGVQARVETLRRLQEETEAEIAALSGAVLAKAFRGELLR